MNVTFCSFLKLKCLFISFLFTASGSGPDLLSETVLLLQAGNDPIAVEAVTPPINQSCLC